MLDANKIKLGIAPIAWTNDDMPELGGEIPFEQCIAEIHEAGFIGTAVGSKYPKDPDVLKQALAPHNLQISSQWFSSFFTTEQKEGTTVEAFKSHMAFLKEMGANIIVISEQGGSIQGQMDTPVFESKPILDDKGWNKLARGLETIGTLALQNGMKIAYHHHMGTVVQSREEIDKLMAISDPKSVFLLADTGHMFYAGGNPADLLSSYQDRIVHIHLKDIRAPILEEVKHNHLSFLQGVKAGVFTVPGDGTIDFQPIFDIIGQSDYEGWLIIEAEQDPAKANPLKYAKKARATIRRLGGI